MYLRGDAVEGELAVIAMEQAQEADYNLSPSRWVGQSEDASHRRIKDLVALANELTATGDALWAKLQPQLERIDAGGNA